MCFNKTRGKAASERISFEKVLVEPKEPQTYLNSGSPISIQRRTELKKARFLSCLCGWNLALYIIYGETDHQPRLVAWDTCSGLVHWEDPEGSGGEGVGRGDQDGEHM